MNTRFEADYWEALEAMCKYYTKYLNAVLVLDKRKHDSALGSEVSTARDLAESDNKQVRESTENCDRTGAAREIGSMADSRGGVQPLPTATLDSKLKSDPATL